MGNYKKTYELTNDAVNDFLKRVDDYCAIPGNDISDLLMEFKDYSDKCILGLYDRMILKYPYDYMARLEKCTDYKRTKIKAMRRKK